LLKKSHRIRRTLLVGLNSAVPLGRIHSHSKPGALKRRAIVNRHFAAQGKTWAGVTVVPSEQVGTPPTFLME
jgi:hypothetical protein